jgi:ABC-type amino acid transport substrate-binding protein
MNVCVVNSTTFARDLPSVLKGDYTLRVVPNMDASYASLVDGQCNVLAGDQFEIAPATVLGKGYTSDYEVGSNFFSKEPLAMVTRQDDSTWSDFVNWIVQGLLEAEEQGITKGVPYLFSLTDVFGEPYRYMFVDAIEEVGHYGEVYERRLEGIVPRRAVNTLNEGSTGTGLMYAMPLGNVESQGPVPAMGSTLHQIRERGFLRCGTAAGAFSRFNETTGESSGFDVDMCRAVSAALFDGVIDTIAYVELSPPERFLALHNGQVDMLARTTTHNLVRDVLEATSKAGFSFSRPYFYDGVFFGGIPP